MSAFDKDTFIAYRKVPSIDTVVLKKNFNGKTTEQHKTLGFTSFNQS